MKVYSFLARKLRQFAEPIFYVTKRARDLKTTFSDLESKYQTLQGQYDYLFSRCKRKYTLRLVTHTIKWCEWPDFVCHPKQFDIGLAEDKPYERITINHIFSHNTTGKSMSSSTEVSSGTLRSRKYGRCFRPSRAVGTQRKGADGHKDPWSLWNGRRRRKCRCLPPWGNECKHRRRQSKFYPRIYPHPQTLPAISPLKPRVKFGQNDQVC